MSVADRQRRRTAQAGVTLVELVISIVIVSIAVTAVLSALSFASTRSADAVIRNQSVAIANAYLEEILLKSYDDPDGSSAGETRATFDDVGDYHGLSDSGARDQWNQSITGLENYTVAVQVVTETLSGITTKRVDVTVTNGSATRLSGYRASY